jgi:hypothetical protein
MEDETVGAEIAMPAVMKDPFEVPFGGLDLRRQDDATSEEIAAFGQFYYDRHAHHHRGLQFMLENRPDALKRFRRFVRIGYVTDDAPEGGYVFGFLSYYAFTMYEVGVQYVVRGLQTAGHSRAHVLDALAIAFLNGGPRGADTIQRALADHHWSECGTPPKIPEGWDGSLGALRSGLDFSDPNLSADELRRLEEWYRDLTGEVPPVVSFLGRHRPDVLKAYRNRYENCLRVLPKQSLPLTLLQMDVFLGHRAGIRENALVAKAFGVTKAQLLRCLVIGLEYGTLATMDVAREAIADILDGWTD